MADWMTMLEMGEHRALQPGGKADAQDHPQAAAVHAQVARLEADVLAGAQQAAEQQSRAEGIGDDGRDGHAVDGHMEHGYEEQIQQHVQHTGHRQRHERARASHRRCGRSPPRSYKAG